MKKYVIVLQIKLTEKAVYVFYQITINFANKRSFGVQIWNLLPETIN